ncbi:hypothetical protein [Methanococcoides sp. NM1]|uniref:hypothetical protein n=1 Tax=Methanococcoides sp. NM1 TaxID=1201013 RepID=UPI0010842D5F|nr:hypothetical protein [Methanococcoides sp. NM1]
MSRFGTSDKRGIKKALDNCFKFLKKGGRLRIVFLDENFPDKDYINYIKPEVHGAILDDHKILYTIQHLVMNLQMLDLWSN